jgi:hypothetical protein
MSIIQILIIGRPSSMLRLNLTILHADLDVDKFADVVEYQNVEELDT